MFKAQRGESLNRASWEWELLSLSDESGDRVDHFYTRSLTGSLEFVIDGRMVNRYVDSPFSLWCDLHAPAERMDPPDAFLEFLRTSGRDLEAKVVAREFPGAVRMTGDSAEDRFRATLEQMAKGTKAIHRPQLFFLAEGLSARPQLIVRSDDAPSHFGPFYYQVVKIKSALKAHAHHRMQLMFENHVLGLVQGFTPASGQMVNREGRRLTVVQDDDALQSVLEEIRRVARGEAVEPVYGGGRWPWSSFTDDRVSKRQDVSLLPGVGTELRKRLAANGFKSIEEVRSADLEVLAQHGNIPLGLAVSLQRAAEAIVTREPMVFAPARLPEAATEVFLDLEGTSNQVYDGDVVDMDYLIGALVRKDGQETHHSFLARGLDEEPVMFSRFYDWARTLEDPVIYHWHDYEPHRLRRMIREHGGGPQAERTILDPLHDLFVTTTRSTVFPTPGNSIKKIAGFIDGSLWGEDDVTGSSSIALYFGFLDDPVRRRDDLERVVAYNKADCIALRTVKDWLQEHAT